MRRIFTTGILYSTGGPYLPPLSRKATRRGYIPGIPGRPGGGAACHHPTQLLHHSLDHLELLEEGVDVLGGRAAALGDARGQRKKSPVDGFARIISPGPSRWRSAIRDSSRSTRPVSDPATSKPSCVSV